MSSLPETDYDEPVKGIQTIDRGNTRMSAVQFHCPLCTGLFQVDDSLAGYQLNCPHCAGLVTVPSLEQTVPFPSGTTFQLGCPLCTGQFQITAEMAGQEVTCPHCYQVVGVPVPKSFGETTFPSSSSPTPPPPPSVQSPREPTTAGHVSQSQINLPTRANKSDDRKTRSDKAPVAATKPVSTSVDALLPPGAATTPVPTTHDSLLPPAAAATTVAAERVPLPASIPTRPKDTVFIPTEKGLVGVHEPVKTIVHRGEEVELRKLTPEEKAMRRMIRNAIFFIACLLILILVFIVLSERQ